MLTRTTPEGDEAIAAVVFAAVLAVSWEEFFQREVQPGKFEYLP
jgi:hypothetical protein